MRTNQPPGVSGSAPQVADLFQPVISSAPPVAALIDQPVTPMNGLNRDGELPSAPARPSGYAQGARRWTSRGTGLVVGTPGAVVALVASAALVLVVGGMTMFTTSSSTELPVVGLDPGPLPAPAMPAISDEHPVTVAPIDAPAGLALQAPATAYPPDPPPASAHQQPLPAAHRAPPAPGAPPPAPDHGPVLSSPESSPPPSTETTEDAGYWTMPTNSHPGMTESRRTDTEECDDCDGSKRKIPNHGDRQSKIDRQRELRAQQAEYRSRSRAQESTLREQGERDRQAARRDAKAGPRS